MAQKPLTLQEVADHFGVRLKHIQRLYERGLLVVNHRVGPYRVVYPDELGTVRKALQDDGRIMSPVEV